MIKHFDDILSRYPKKRIELPDSYQNIYDKHYKENRNGSTFASNLSSKLESWLHRQVAKSANPSSVTLEIGAGTLNQLKFEQATPCYDIIEPYKDLYMDSSYLKNIRTVYSDISEVPVTNKYDRITSCACFEHICNLPEVVEKCTKLLNENGKLCASIPNEGRFLWKFAYQMTTGLEFRKRYGLDYEVLMNYEHVNTADEIDIILRYYFKDVKMKMLGIGKTFSFYRYYECTNPIVHNEKECIINN